jgi:SAM-dependent methyltransferase
MTELFSGTSACYRSHRPGIPVEVARILDEAAPAGEPRRLLDLGTGTGLVVKALINRFDEVVALDPDEGMIAAARAELEPLLPEGARLDLEHGRVGAAQLERRRDRRLPVLELVRGPAPVRRPARGIRRTDAQDPRPARPVRCIHRGERVPHLPRPAGQDMSARPMP